MKSKTQFILVACVLFSFLTACTSVREKEGWEGTIEEVDGVEVIHNPAEPLHGELALELEEDLVIGGDVEDENFNFMRIAALEVDDEGNLYVLDFRQCRIQVFNKDGDYLQTIGRKGEGPGEFQRPSRMYLSPDGKLYVIEFRKIHLFDREGTYEKSIIPETPILGMSIAEEGSILGRSYTYGDEGRSFDIILMDSEGKKVETITSFPDPSVILTQAVSGGAISMGGPPPYSPGLSFCSLSEGLAVYGYSSEYTLFVVNSSGEIIRRIEKEEERQPTSKQEEDEYVKDRLERSRARAGGIKWSEGDLRKLYKFAEYKPFFSNIVKDDEGHLFLLKPKSVLNPEEDTYYDMFSLEGFYIYKVKIHMVNPRVIKKGYIYTFGEDPDTGYYEIERYRIRNWDQIKK
jgi:hypothetical protein